MPSEAPTPHIPYSITSKEKTEKLRPDGRFEEVWRVGYQGPDGTHSWIEVPTSEYSAQRVDELISEELQTTMEVHQLGEQPHPDNLAE